MFKHLNSGENKTLINLFIWKHHIQTQKWANTKLNIHWYKTELMQSYNTLETKKQSVHFEYLILLLQIPYFHTFKTTKQKTWNTFFTISDWIFQLNIVQML